MKRPGIDQQVTFLYANDFDEMIKFYGGVLGLKMVLDQGACRIYETGGNSYVGICQSSSIGEEHKDIIVTFVSEQVDEWYMYLGRKGVDVEKPPAHNEKYNIYHLFLRDPSGYLLEIQTFLDPAWPKAV